MDEVDSIVKRRAGLGKVVIVTIRGIPIKLESGAGPHAPRRPLPAEEMVKEFERVKAFV